MLVCLPIGSALSGKKMSNHGKIETYAGDLLYCSQDCRICNAGNGSNWTYGGHVECDASVMSGDGAFGAVGAVSGTCRLAHCLYASTRHQPQTKLLLWPWPHSKHCRQRILA